MGRKMFLICFCLKMANFLIRISAFPDFLSTGDHPKIVLRLCWIIFAIPKQLMVTTRRVQQLGNFSLSPIIEFFTVNRAPLVV